MQFLAIEGSDSDVKGTCELTQAVLNVLHLIALDYIPEKSQHFSVIKTPYFILSVCVSPPVFLLLSPTPFLDKGEEIMGFFSLLLKDLLDHCIYV